MITPTNHVIARPGYTLSRALDNVGILQHLPAKYGRKPKKVLPSERGALGTVPYGKFGPWSIDYVYKKSRSGPEVATFRKKNPNFTRCVHLNWLEKLN